MTPSLNPQFFPHIWEAILRHTDRSTLLTARLVSLSLCDLADRLLSGDHLVLETFGQAGRPALIAMSDGSNLEPINRVSPYRKVPFFHPDGDLRVQHRAMNHARRLFLNCSFATTRLNRLLQHVHPLCSVELWRTVHHNHSFATHISVPPCASLSLQIPMGCSCNNATAK